MFLKAFMEIYCMRKSYCTEVTKFVSASSSLRTRSFALLKAPTHPSALCQPCAATRIYNSELTTQWFFPVLLEVVWVTDFLWLTAYEPEQDTETPRPPSGVPLWVWRSVRSRHCKSGFIDEDKREAGLESPVTPTQEVWQTKNFVECLKLNPPGPRKGSPPLAIQFPMFRTQSKN